MIGNWFTGEVNFKVEHHGTWKEKCLTRRGDLIELTKTDEDWEPNYQQ